MSTVAAVNRRVEGYAIARFKSFNAVANPLNHSRSFMSHDDRGNAASRRSVVSMNVAATYSTCCDAHQQFARASFRCRYVSQLKLTILGKQQCLHGLAAQ